MRQRGRLAGFSLYISASGNITGSFRCYKDGPQLPPLNFTTTCFTTGRYAIFYNERLDGVTYPGSYQTSQAVTMELCEVIVLGKDDIIRQLITAQTCYLCFKSLHFMITSFEIKIQKNCRFFFYFIQRHNYKFAGTY